jgi:hypothetical protein
MSVENVKVKFIRPKGYQNLKEWIADNQNIYIGRSGIVFIDKKRFPKKGSLFANPFKVGKHGTRNKVIQKYRKYITDKLEKSPELVHKLKDMKGKKLGCWCHPEPCHGDILLELIEKYT